MDAIREVLLGDRLRKYEQRFELLDKTVQSNHGSNMMATRGDVAAALQSMAGTLFLEGRDVKAKAKEKKQA